MADHAARTKTLRDTMALRRADDTAPLRLAKASSNLFRDRASGARSRLDLSAFDHVLRTDAAGGWVDAEGLTRYEHLVNATLAQGLMPAVVPQLKTITVGGAVSGVGIEATSFRRGLVHDTMLELDVLLPGGDIVACTPDNEHSDLFRGFANSYGTLGYALRVRLRTLPVQPFVRVEHRAYTVAEDFFETLSQAHRGTADFVDGVVFGPGRMIANVGHFTDQAPWLSDYGYEHIYYQSLTRQPIDYLRTLDYLWRWDTDWFWCSRNVGAQHPLVRWLLGRKRLNSHTYTKLMRWNARWGITRRLARCRGLYPESVIQDVDIPAGRAAEFLNFLLEQIGILPIWICPIRAADPAKPFPLYPRPAGEACINFGFWDVVYSPVAREAGHFNRLVEREVQRLGGIKSLYSDSFFTREEFAMAYDMDSYTALKTKYDPQHRALGLYDKCVLRA